MHTKTLKKLALALTFWLALHTTSLKAQILGPLGPYTDDSATLSFDSSGIFSVTGAGTGTLTLSGAGTKMFWYPKLGAFRAGYVDGSEWDAANIGKYSVAFGWDTTASGLYSVAFGHNASASGTGSVAFGCYSSASNYYSVAFGFVTQASGVGSVAMGQYSTASNKYATAFGSDSSASGAYSMATGSYTSASGKNSTASGYQTTASGYNSTASGYQATANSLDSFVVGAYNTGKNENPTHAVSPTSWNHTLGAADPLFEVGNGTGTGTSASDALVVYKDGNAKFPATTSTVTAATFVTTAASGDIPMYTGN